MQIIVKKANKMSFLFKASDNFHCQEESTKLSQTFARNVLMPQ